jgi:hypothetical protein
LSLEKLRIEVITPRFYKNGKKIEANKFLETDKELRKRFKGCSMMPNFKGTWIGNHGIVHRDRNTGFWVDVSNTKENLLFFKQYKNILKKRFKQEEIYIVGHEIYVI